MQPIMILFQLFKRRLWSLLPILFVFQFGYGQKTVSAVTWNLENFGKTKTESTMQLIANTLHRYDVIAIQEVVGNSGGVDAVNRLTTELNKIFPQGNWKNSASPKTSGSPGESERYAFIWNENQINLVGKAWLEKRFALEMVREPYLGTFAAGKDTFTLVSFHAIPKSRQPEREIKYLKFFPAQYPKLNLIFLGDFNTPQSNNVFYPLRKMGYQAALAGQKTTLKMKCKEGQCLASEYDNIFYDSKQIKMVKAGILRFYRAFPDMVAARKVSDHVPVVVEFLLR